MQVGVETHRHYEAHSAEAIQKVAFSRREFISIKEVDGDVLFSVGNQCKKKKKNAVRRFSRRE
jgi:hypothetical protein